jgi:hypothetical protein
VPVIRLNGTEVIYSEVGGGVPCLVMHGGMGFDHSGFDLSGFPTVRAWLERIATHTPTTVPITRG